MGHSAWSPAGGEADVQAAQAGLLRLSPAKAKVVHLSEGFDFPGFRLQWRRKRGRGDWYVYTFIAERPLRALIQDWGMGLYRNGPRHRHRHGRGRYRR